jgi:hypothetical protein
MNRFREVRHMPIEYSAEPLIDGLRAGVNAMMTSPPTSSAMQVDARAAIDAGELGEILSERP